MQLKIQFVSHANHTLSAQLSRVAAGYCTGQYTYGSFPSVHSIDSAALESKPPVFRNAPVVFSTVSKAAYSTIL